MRFSIIYFNENNLKVKIDKTMSHFSKTLQKLISREARSRQQSSERLEDSAEKKAGYPAFCERRCVDVRDGRLAKSGGQDGTIPERQGADNSRANASRAIYQDVLIYKVNSF